MKNILKIIKLGKYRAEKTFLPGQEKILIKFQNKFLICILFIFNTEITENMQTKMK